MDDTTTARKAAQNLYSYMRMTPRQQHHIERCIALGRNCDFDEEHAFAVTRLALLLFDALRDMHGLSPRERFWLTAGALMHDIGYRDTVDDHHKASCAIILDSPMLTFKRNRRFIIGSIARYHRRGFPKNRHANMIVLPRSKRESVRVLAALLRIADGLDSQHRTAVRSLAVKKRGDTVHIRIKGKDVDEECEKAFDKSDLFSRVFSLNVQVTQS